MTETTTRLEQLSESLLDKLPDGEARNELLDLIEEAVSLGIHQAETIKAERSRRQRARAVERRNRENGWNTGKPGWEPPDREAAA